MMINIYKDNTNTINNNDKRNYIRKYNTFKYWKLNIVIGSKSDVDGRGRKRKLEAQQV